MNIAGYRIEKQIGRGGMAMVYLAIQESLHRPVALKVMNPLYSDSAEFSERFLNEGRILASIRHSNIITIHDIGISGNFHFISMEYVEGGDLAARLKQGISADEAVNMVETIASCLDAAHDVHIVHRDIKPANILFRNDGTLLLTDFGIAKQLGVDQNLTATGTMVGSPHYLSPEQAQGKSVDGRSDIYSLGIIYYELLTGERPFTGESEVDVAIKHLKEPMPHLPDYLSAHQPIIDSMTRKNIDERFPSCKSLLVALKEFKIEGKWSGNMSNIPLTTTEPPQTVATKPARKSQQQPAGPQAESATGETVVDQTIPDSEMVTQPVNSTTDADPSERTTVISVARPGIGAAMKFSVIIASVLLLVTGAFVVGNLMMSQPDEVQSPQKVVTAPEAPQPSAEKPSAIETDEEQQRQEIIRQQQEKLRQQKINNLLKVAEVAIDNYHLTTPPDTSAYYYYREILKIDPDNKAAKEGIDKIVELYYRLARKAVDDWDYDRAKQLVSAGLSVRPNEARLLDLNSELTRKDGKTTRSIKNSLKDVKGWFE